MRFMWVMDGESDTHGANALRKLRESDNWIRCCESTSCEKLFCNSCLSCCAPNDEGSAAKVARHFELRPMKVKTQVVKATAKQSRKT